MSLRGSSKGSQRSTCISINVSRISRHSATETGDAKKRQPLVQGKGMHLSMHGHGP
jgi:hypothetical protein